MKLTQNHPKLEKTTAAFHFLSIINGWLLAVTLEYLGLAKALRPLTALTGLAQMSLARVLTVTAVGYLLQIALHRWPLFEKYQRWLTVTFFGVYAVCGLIASFTWPFLAVCIVMMAGLVLFALFGWNGRPPLQPEQKKESRKWRLPVAGLALVFFCTVSAWTVARVRNLWTPSFDFGIFAQMFHYMKETGIPFTTIERDGLLSHFAVHISPIYYLMLPFYCLVPRPETLQVLQAAVLAGAVIPLWKLGKHHGLSPLQRTLVCAVLLVYPAYAGGVSYDIHENCFLPPLILWLLYGLDRKSIPLTAIFGALTLLVKEDAPVYVAVIGLYVLVRSILRKEKWGILAGTGLLLGAIGYFLGATAYLASAGDGVMNYRYNNFMYDGSNSLVTVVKAVVLCPLKAVFECVDREKLEFIALTMLPLAGLPLLTRRYENLILLIPYVLINLMSDYPYQHNILFQYTFGSTACLMYLVVVNLADLKERVRFGAAALAVCIGIGCFCANIVPPVSSSISAAIRNGDSYAQQRAFLDTVPDGASVAATTFYTTCLSDRETLYDVQYASPEHILECEYVVIRHGADFENYYGGTWQNEEGFVRWLLRNGYTLEKELESVAQIYRKWDQK